MLLAGLRSLTFWLSRLGAGLFGGYRSESRDDCPENERRGQVI